jgi:5,6,7,8-tetrahydromethanopterin hydro-lyase
VRSTLRLLRIEIPTHQLPGVAIPLRLGGLRSVRAMARRVVELDGRSGEAASGTGLHQVVVTAVLAQRGSATAAAVLGALASPTHRFAPQLVGPAPGQAIRPSTVMVHRTPIGTPRLTMLTSGPLNTGIAAGVLDALADGQLRTDEVDELVIMCTALLDPELEQHPVDATVEATIERHAREATSGAIAAAVNPTPRLVVEEMIAAREQLRRA